MKSRTSKRLSQVLGTSPELTFSCGSKIIMMSDCHRGVGTWADNFLNNQNLFFAALTYYYENDYTYIELGDGDELWENRRLDQIISAHSSAYWLLSQFYRKGRLHMLFGNHDMAKKCKKYVGTHCQSYYSSGETIETPLLPGIAFHEGLILRSKETGDTIFLVHGHQGDLLNDTLWKLSRFLVRYLWKRLELAGFHDPTSAAKNYVKKDKVERRLSSWAEKHKQPTICGHTHRPVLPNPGDGLYFNDGSCVHPRCITGLEIENGAISLVKWAVCTREDRSLYVEREVLEGPFPLCEYH